MEFFFFMVLDSFLWNIWSVWIKLKLFQEIFYLSELSANQFHLTRILMLFILIQNLNKQTTSILIVSSNGEYWIELNALEIWSLPLNWSVWMLKFYQAYVSQQVYWLQKSCLNLQLLLAKRHVRHDILIWWEVKCLSKSFGVLIKRKKENCIALFSSFYLISPSPAVLCIEDFNPWLGLLSCPASSISTLMRVFSTLSMFSLAKLSLPQHHQAQVNLMPGLCLLISSLHLSQVFQQSSALTLLF